MTTIGAPPHKWTAVCLLLCSFACAQSTNETRSVESSSATTSTPPKSPSYTESTCPYRTINHITHTLLQQCLRTGISAPTPSALIVDQPSEAEATDAPEIVIPWERNPLSDSGAEAKAGSLPSTPPLQPAAIGSSDATGSTSSTNTHPEAETETDSPFDNANFLSFEEWKKRNLEQAGQSLDNVGQGRAVSSDQRDRRRPVNLNALDSLGEEGEIDIDFSGFGNPADGEAIPTKALSESQDSTEAAEAENKAAPSTWALTKDAGKTCKERFNYASFDCAATVLKTNPKAKSSSSILVENKDSYMLNECSAENKYIVVELCDDILVDTVVLANYEFFSSMFRHFRVSVSDRYPVKMDRWRVLGTFEARNSRDIQAFLVTEPQIWARYLRIEFLTHYGNEYYCPMSLLRVHGTTMMEQFRREEEQARGDDDFTEPLDVVDGASAQTAVTQGEDNTIPAEPVPSVSEKRPQEESPEDTSLGSGETPSHASSTEKDTFSPTLATPSTDYIGASSGASIYSVVQIVPHVDSLANLSTPSSIKDNSEKSLDVSSDRKTEPSSVSSPSDGASSSTGSSTDGKVDEPKSGSKNKHDVTPPTNISSGKPAPHASNNSSHSSSQTRASSQTQPNVATPTTQESFFKSIHKRLQYLEANSTLSLQYIEEQSRILRDAFMKVEKKQLQKTEKFLDHLNSTVRHELKSYRNLYEQLWQSTILELEGIKERHKVEMVEIGTRLSMVGDELVWQKRLAVVQSTLLLLCLGLVLFVRSGPQGSQTDVPIVQQLGNTYSSFFDSPARSPEGDRRSRRRRTFRNMWRSDASAGMSDRSNSDMAMAVSDAETDGRRSPLQVSFGPPTPATVGDYSVDDRKDSIDQAGKIMQKAYENGLLTPTEDDGDSLDEQAKRLEILETQSGPATPRGSRDSRPSWEEVERAVDELKAEERGEVPQLDTRAKKRQVLLRRSESYSGSGVDSPDDGEADQELFLGD